MTATLPCGICTTRRWYGSSRVTRTVRHALTSVRMVVGCGREDWIIRCDRGICVRADNCSSMTLVPKSFRWDIVRRVSEFIVFARRNALTQCPYEFQATGWRLAWRTRMSKCYMQQNQRNTSYICTKVVCCHYVLPRAASGLCRRARIIYLTLGEHPTEPAYSR